MDIILIRALFSPANVPAQTINRQKGIGELVNIKRSFWRLYVYPLELVLGFTARHEKEDIIKR